MANYASYLSPDNTETPKLSDRLFEVLPSIRLLWLTDLADLLMFIPTAFLVTTHYRPLYLLCKMLLTLSLCNLMRITTIAITSFPDPRDGCVHTVGEFYTTFTLHRCGDCMFSGHTIIFVVSGLVWTSHGYHRFPERLRWLAVVSIIFIWCLCVGSAIVIIVNRAHYTVDVLVAFYIAGGNFYIWTYVFEHYIEDRGHLRDLTHPWGDGLDPRPHIQKREQIRQKRATDAEKLAMARQLEEARLRSVDIEIPPIPKCEPLSTSVYDVSIPSRNSLEIESEDTAFPSISAPGDSILSIVSHLHVGASDPSSLISHSE
ncbi:hypothetical protein BGZ50_000124 [Haplosporangium sp. Z 11]|nr:hypothetical protein BGZ50_000124 [Haplosporangium sp. Z 11]